MQSVPVTMCVMVALVLATTGPGTFPKLRRTFFSTGVFEIRYHFKSWPVVLLPPSPVIVKVGSVFCGVHTLVK